MKNLNSKTILILIALLTFFSCKKQASTIDPKDNEYLSMRIGEFSAKEIGEFHNKVLEVLKNDNQIKGTKEGMIHSIQNAKLDKRIKNTDVEIAIINLQKMGLFQNAINSKKDKPQTLEELKENVLNLLVDEDEISIEAKNVLLNLEFYGLSEIEDETNKLISSSLYTEREKEYFSVFTSIYVASNEFWNPDNASARWKPYAADAIGGILGLYASPAFSIFQGALLSAAFDED